MAAEDTRVVIRANRLGEIRRRIAAGAPPVVAKAALDIEGRAKMYAPYDTGALRNSIRAEQLNEALWRVVVGVEYGIYQEYGTRYMAAHPYMRPAFEQVAPSLLAALRSLLR